MKVSLPTLPPMMAQVPRRMMLAGWMALAAHQAMYQKEQPEATHENPRVYFETVNNNQGWIGRSWDFVKCNLGTRDVNPDGSRTSLPERMLAKVVNRNRCSESVRESLNQWEAGRLSTPEMIQQVDQFTLSQTEGVELIAPALAGIAPFRVAGIIRPIQIGIATNVGLKFSDTLGSNNPYPLHDLFYDSLVGGLAGAYRPIAAGTTWVASRVIDNRIVTFLQSKVITRTVVKALTQPVYILQHGGSMHSASLAFMDVLMRGGFGAGVKNAVTKVQEEHEARAALRAERRENANRETPEDVPQETPNALIPNEALREERN